MKTVKDILVGFGAKCKHKRRNAHFADNIKGETLQPLVYVAKSNSKTYFLRDQHFTKSWNITFRCCKNNFQKYIFYILQDACK
jgi:hypothetical protein